MCRCELFEEAGVVFGEHAQVAHTVFEVGDALYTHTECVAGVDLAVYAARLEDIGVDHATSQNLDPSCVLAEAASLAAADVATDVHLCTGLSEGEVAGTETNLGVGAEHFAGEGEQHLLEVGEADILVDIQAFDLMEEIASLRYTLPGQMMRIGGS